MTFRPDDPRLRPSVLKPGSEGSGSYDVSAGRPEKGLFHLNLGSEGSDSCDDSVGRPRRGPVTLTPVVMRYTWDKVESHVFFQECQSRQLVSLSDTTRYSRSRDPIRPSQSSGVDYPCVVGSQPDLLRTERRLHEATTPKSIGGRSGLRDLQSFCLIKSPLVSQK